METPPPFPPSLPPSLPPPFPPSPVPKKAGMSGCMIGAIIGGVLLVLAAVLVIFVLTSLYKLGAAKTALLTPEKPAKPVPLLTEDQKIKAMQFGAQLVTALNANDFAELETMTDFDASAARSFPNWGPADLKNIVKFIKDVPGGFLRPLTGNHAKVLGLHTREGFPALTLRINLSQGGVSYQDVIVRPDGDGFKVVDTFNYTYGALASAETRQRIVFFAGMAKPAVAKPLGMEEASEADIERVVSLATKQAQRDFKGAISDYHALPPRMQKARPPFTIYLTALQYLGREPAYAQEYAAALESAPAILGRESATEILLLDQQLLNKDYKGVERGIDKARQIIGDDAYLLQLKGSAALLDQDLPTAEESLATAEKLEPDLVTLVDLRLQVRAMKGDFAGVVAELRRFAETTATVVTPAKLKAPVFDEFKRSPEFAEWAKAFK